MATTHIPPTLPRESADAPVVSRSGRHGERDHWWDRVCELATGRRGNPGGRQCPPPGFHRRYNARFAKPPANDKDLHRPLRAGDDLDDAFAWKEERTLSQALTLQYDKVMFILEPSEQATAAIGKRVTVVDYPPTVLAQAASANPLLQGESAKKMSPSAALHAR